MRLIGLTGPMQSGKQELAEVFRRFGAEFLDLNLLADSVRLSHIKSYSDLGLGQCIAADGSKKLEYYLQMLSDPAMFQRFMDFELPLVLTEALSALAKTKAETVVVSWGYLYLLFDSLPLDFILLFQADREIWLKRIRKRVSVKGDGSVDLSDEAILRLASVIGMDPLVIQAAVVKKYGNHWSAVDTSADDWGEAALTSCWQKLQHI